MKLGINFEKILPSNQQIQDLYELLKKRKYLISHKLLPEFEDHKRFVLKNPYKYWYFVLLEKVKIGTFYITFSNSIGINLINHDQDTVEILIEYIRKNFIPEEPKSSLVPEDFHINISSENKELKKIFNKLNIKIIQETYRI